MTLIEIYDVFFNTTTLFNLLVEFDGPMYLPRLSLHNPSIINGHYNIMMKEAKKKPLVLQTGQCMFEALRPLVLPLVAYGWIVGLVSGLLTTWVEPNMSVDATGICTLKPIPCLCILWGPSSLLARGDWRDTMLWRSSAKGG